MPPSLPTDHPWMSLGEASRHLGITPATLRRWADRGEVAAFVTPGGHRRFPRTVIESLVPSPAAHFASAGLAPTARRMAMAYRRARPGGRPSPPWIAALTEEQRLEFRDRGRRLLSDLLALIADPEKKDSAPKLAAAEAEAEAYGRRAAGLGASLTETVDAFVRFRSAFIGELALLARRRGLGTGPATGLLVEAERSIDRLLVALMRAHGDGR